MTDRYCSTTLPWAVREVRTFNFMSLECLMGLRKIEHIVFFNEQQMILPIHFNNAEFEPHHDKIKKFEFETVSGSIHSSDSFLCNIVNV